MKSLLLVLIGFFLGLWTSWPGIVKKDNWKCFRDIIDKSLKEQISLKAALAVSPSYLLKGNSNKSNSKIRIVFDACFR
tara:strand:- start:200 stop:433 length:234 start_codon:yes stop_codon:yes gene_type:complete